MSRTAMADVLRGLVSDQAADAYEQLHAGAHVPIGADGERTLGPERELIEAGAVCVGGSGRARFLRAVDPVLAVRRQLDRQHRDLVKQQADLAVAWERFATLLSPTGGMPGESCDGEDIRVIHDHAEMAALAAGLYRSPNRVLRGTFTRGSAHGPTTEGILLPPRDAIAAGVEFRMLYDAAHVSDVWGARSVRESVRAGEQARVRRTLPVKMMHVDDKVALITLDDVGEKGALHIRSSAMVVLLAEWFDALWTAPGTSVVGGAAADELTPARLKVVRLLAVGMTDEAIARQTGTGVRTVRRHVGAILEILGVDSRFAAGAAAAKRGWL